MKAIKEIRLQKLQNAVTTTVCTNRRS